LRETDICTEKEKTPLTKTTTKTIGYLFSAHMV